MSHQTHLADSELLGRKHRSRDDTARFEQQRSRHDHFLSFMSIA
jgi:hypothetical protein